MECEKCQNKFDSLTLGAYILLPCTHTLCTLCVHNQNLCPKCEANITSKITKRLRNELSGEYYQTEKIYQEKYKEIYFLESGGYGCVYIVKNISDHKMYVYFFVPDDNKAFSFLMSQ